MPMPLMQGPQGQSVNKQQLEELIKNLEMLAATSEQKVFGLKLMGDEFIEEPSVLRWHEMFGEKFTQGLRNWLAATLATEQLQHQGVLSQLEQFRVLLRQVASGLVLPAGVLRQ